MPTWVKRWPSNSQTWWPSASRRSAGPGPPEPVGQAALEGVGRLDDVVVDRDDRDPDVPGFGLGQEQRLVQGGDLGHDLSSGHRLRMRVAVRP